MPESRSAAWPGELVPRLARTSLLGLSIATLAALAHSGGGHPPPPVTVVLVGAAVLTRCCWRASLGELTPRRCLLLSVAAQWVLHVTFTLIDPPERVHELGPVGARPTVELCDLVPGAGDASMLVAHMLAATALALWLAAGERLLWSVARRARRRLGDVVTFGAELATLVRSLVRLSEQPASGCELRAHQPLTAPVRPWLPLLSHVVIRRGPPAACAVGHP
ncbi:MAG TPA: hypothetical protein VMT69_01865 [Kineosporiaceae bacterium]|nr:hypothetical protein [Kineosporiaceae bacterium]